MSDIIFKLGLVPSYVINGLKSWYYEVWIVDLDTHWCCNGEECGCGGLSHREMMIPEERS